MLLHYIENCLTEQISVHFDTTKITSACSEVSGLKCRLPLRNEHVKLNGEIVKDEERKENID